MQVIPQIRAMILAVVIVANLAIADILEAHHSD